VTINIVQHLIRVIEYFLRGVIFGYSHLQFRGRGCSDHWRIAQAFGTAGATVVITARRAQWLEEAERQLKDQGVIVHAMIGDVADPASVEQMVQRALEACGKIDILANNAGLTWGAPAETMPLPPVLF
jgi:hypothetical protein